MIFLRRAAACFILPHRKRAWRTPRRYGAPAPLSLARFHPGHRRATFPARRADTMRWSTIKATVCHAPARRGALRHGLRTRPHAFGSGLVHHDRGPPDRLAAALGVGGDGIADRLPDVALFRDLAGPLMHICVVALEADPHSHRMLLPAGRSAEKYRRSE